MAPQDLRQSLHRLSSLASVSLNGAPPSDTPAGDDPALHGDMLDLDREFRRLSRRQRTAVVLHKGCGYTIDECAELMGCSRGSVRTHYQRGLTRLKKELSEP